MGVEKFFHGQNITAIGGEATTLIAERHSMS
jgi:hypothetical protein